MGNQNKYKSAFDLRHAAITTSSISTTLVLLHRNSVVFFVLTAQSFRIRPREYRFSVLISDDMKEADIPKLAKNESEPFM